MKLIDTIKLWMMGLGIPLSLLENERVKFELAQTPIDGVGLLQAFQNNIYALQYNEEVDQAIKVLNNAQCQLELISLVNSGGDSMLTFS